MAYDSAPDIYLMKRQKTRAGCMTALIVMASCAVLAAVAFGIYKWSQRPDDPGIPAEPVALPAGDVEAPLEPAVLPEPPPEAPGSGAGDLSASSAQPVAPAANGTPAVPSAPEPAAAPATPAAPPVPVPPTPEAAAEALAKAKAARDAGDLQAARMSALSALAAAPGDPATEQLLNELAMPLLASRHAMPEKVHYSICSGDYLGKIAAKFNTPVALIAVANGIADPTRIRVGQELLLLDGNAHVFALEVSKSRNDLLVTLDGAFFKRYRVATGVNGKTPTGTFKIVDKIEHPAWHVPGRTPIPYGDPENQLGTHWLALDVEGYGIHGTWAPESIGSQSSDGCVRLLNDDVKELYTILPKGTAVAIVE